MESRLPKPKITAKKIINAMDASNNNKQPPAKNMENIAKAVTNTKANENKLPKPLVRSRTQNTIIRTDVTKPIKRAATTVAGTSEAKKPFVKPKALANRPALNNNATNKGMQSEATGKIQKWDLRGRLAQANDKLTISQQKKKDIETKYNELQMLTDTLKASEAAFRNKAEQLQASNNAMSNELGILTAEVSTMQRKQEDLTKRLKESEESYENVSHKFKELKEKHNAQGILLSEQDEQLTTLRVDLECQKKINANLSIEREELQSLTHKMDRERRALHNNIQELKGNIRVFCRVRPRTPKEIELVKP